MRVSVTRDDCHFFFVFASCRAQLRAESTSMARGDIAQLPPITPLGQPGSAYFGKNNKLASAAAAADTTYDIVDVPSLKLRISTLASEKEYLLKDNTLLKNRLTNLNAAVAKLEKRVKSSTEKNRHMERDIRAGHGTLKNLAERYYRAEKVATFLERQIMEAVPGARLDFAAVDQPTTTRLEPSIQLLEALTTRVYRENLERAPAQHHMLTHPSRPL